MLFGGEPETLISTDYQRHKKRNRFIFEAFDAIDSPVIRRVRPDQILCDTFIPGRCAAQVDGVPFYYDDDHLSLAGSVPVVAAVMDTLRLRP